MIDVEKIQEATVWQALEEVMDPEVPVLSVIDLGVVRGVELFETPNGQGVRCFVTPTYTGCPATEVIAMAVRMQLLQLGFYAVEVKTVLSPPWTTEWMTGAGKIKLKKYGIAPPNPQHTICTPEEFQQQEAVQCPQCNSWHTVMISRFGSTPCKALYRCEECKEPFDYFKCH